MNLRFLKWVLVALLAPPLLALLFVLVFGFNWARGPLQRLALEKTGRELVIAGDLSLRPAWPVPLVRAQGVSFANPPWAQERQMLVADTVEVGVDLLALLRGRLSFPEMHLTRPTVFLEATADGRKTWLLDMAQSDENARIPIGRITLDHGRLGYDDTREKTRIRAELSTTDATAGLVFSATGTYRGLALAAQGSGGPVLALRDESQPYALKVEAGFGRTNVKAEGTITSLLKFSAADLMLWLQGESLAQLYPLLGIALPATRPYVTAGRIVHDGQAWRYEKFSGRIGRSDIGGTLQVDTGGKRPFMHGALVSQRLDLVDLGPLIGTGAVGMTDKPAATGRVLPELPFNTERWDSVDADVTLRAGAILRSKETALEALDTHLLLRDAVLTLDPLDFGLAGGHLKAVIKLDGRANPIRANARVGARRIQMARMFPAVQRSAANIGQIDGDFQLAGSGNSVGRMLATADGRVSLVVGRGQISKLLMETAGLHLLEMLQLKLGGDKPVELRCAVADFGVQRGVMTANALLLDTDVSTVLGSGSIDLGAERLDLTLKPGSRNATLISLRSPIRVTGSFAAPQAGIDKLSLLARGAGAVALGLVNPLLVLAPLVELGHDQDSPCAEMIRAAGAPRSAGK